MRGQRLWSWLCLLGAVAISLVLILLTPGAAHKWYQVSAGNHYNDLRSSGVPHDKAIAPSLEEGFLCASLMVGGTSVPFVGLVLVTAAMMRGFHSGRVVLILRLTFAFFMLVGIACLGAAHRRIFGLPDEPAVLSFLLAFVLWLVVGGFFVALAAVAGFIRRRLAKKRESQTAPITPAATGGLPASVPRHSENTG